MTARDFDFTNLNPNPRFDISDLAASAAAVWAVTVARDPDAREGAAGSSRAWEDAVKAAREERFWDAIEAIHEAGTFSYDWPENDDSPEVEATDILMAAAGQFVVASGGDRGILRAYQIGLGLIEWESGTTFWLPIEGLIRGPT